MHASGIGSQPAAQTHYFNQTNFLQASERNAWVTGGRTLAGINPVDAGIQQQIQRAAMARNFVEGRNASHQLTHSASPRWSVQQPIHSHQIAGSAEAQKPERRLSDALVSCCNVFGFCVDYRG